MLSFRSPFRLLAALCLLLFVAAACGGDGQAPSPEPILESVCPKAYDDPRQSYWVCAVGDRRDMLRTGNLQGQLALSDLPTSANLIAVGPIRGLKGEITIDQGAVYLSTILNGEQVVKEGAETEAIFLAFGAAEAWQGLPIPEPLRGFDAIEAFLQRAALEAGLDPEQPFPFRITGTPPTLAYHVIFKSGHGGHGQGGHHDHAAHKKAKVPFDADNRPVSIVGLWADEASIGRYTHEGRRSHMHAILDDRSGAGHVDALELSPGMTLYLPMAQN
ncbi:MAG: hypothetical protein AAF788_04875 [Pseudomonadota bacterium]